MSKAEHVSNHSVNTETGFIESNGFITAFDSDRKLAFLRLLKVNGLGLYRTCSQLGLSTHTVNKHYRIDPEFKRLYDELEVEYTDELEATSRINALNPKSVIERIFQLKALRPEKYADEKKSGAMQISISFDGKTLELAKKRAETIDAELIPGTPDLATGSTQLSDKKDETKT